MSGTPQRWKISWRECANFIIGSVGMRLERHLYAISSRRYPSGLRQDLRVYPWLLHQLPWMPLVDPTPPPKSMGEQLEEYRHTKNVPAYREIDYGVIAVVTFQKWLHHQTHDNRFASLDATDRRVQTQLLAAIAPIFAEYREAKKHGD